MHRLTDVDIRGEEVKADSASLGKRKTPTVTKQGQDGQTKHQREKDIRGVPSKRRTPTVTQQGERNVRKTPTKKAHQPDSSSSKLSRRGRVSAAAANTLRDLEATKRHGNEGKDARRPRADYLGFTGSWGGGAGYSSSQDLGSQGWSDSTYDDEDTYTYYYYYPDRV